MVSVVLEGCLVVWRSCRHVAQKMMLAMITEWFWGWKRMGMH